jgi:O-antigen ligase
MTITGKNKNIKFYLTTIAFTFFLFPFSLAIGNEGLSANYAFVFFPLLLIVNNSYLKRPPDFILLYLVLFTSIFLVATVYQIEFIDFFPRRIISFILFIIMFSYLFIDIDETMVNSFKLAIVIIATYFAFTTFYKYFATDASAIGFAAKGEIGSQRFGFVYLAAIWLCWFYKTKSFFSTFVRYSLILIILIGLLLTFSRSGIVALGTSVFFFILNNFLIWIKKPNFNGAIKFVKFFTFFSFIFFFLGAIFPVLFEFFDVRLFSFFSGNGKETVDLVDSDSSEGFRVFLFYTAVEFVSNNPFTGSGFLGIWVLFNDLSGSAHNQYLDIFFRTGYLGFFAYMYLLYWILEYLFKKDRSLFWGVFGIVVYGLFHETFKLSQGAFIFSFLLGMVGSDKKKSIYL